MYTVALGCTEGDTVDVKSHNLGDHWMPLLFNTSVRNIVSSGMLHASSSRPTACCYDRLKHYQARKQTTCSSFHNRTSARFQSIAVGKQQVRRMKPSVSTVDAQPGITSFTCYYIS